jgi:hypothetical protein
MPKHLIRLEGEPLFNLWSYARPGSSRRDRTLVYMLCTGLTTKGAIGSCPEWL